MTALRNNRTVAHVAPFLAFMLLLPLVDWIKIDNPYLPWWRSAPEHWVYPLQTVIALALLAWQWPSYEFGPRNARVLAMGAAIGILGIAFWIIPSAIYRHLPESFESWPSWLKTGTGITSRAEPGFNPDIFPPNSMPWWSTMTLRFIRLCVAVPFLEEIFWRGFLWRYLAYPDRDFWRAPFAIWKPRAIALTISAFVLVHHPADYFGCLIYGILISWLALRTKSLAACIVCHAVSNLALGIYVVRTKEWGFW